MSKKLIKITSAVVILTLLFVVVGEISSVLAQSPTATASATPTASPETLPDAGVSMPTMLGMIIGIIAIFGSLALAF